VSQKLRESFFPRYVLVKAESSPTAKLRTPSPTKMEESLLKRRLPAQHQALMRALGKPDSDEDRLGESKSNGTGEIDSLAPETRHAQRRIATSSDAVSRSWSSLQASRTSSAKNPPQHFLRESSPALLPSLVRDSTFMSVLHRKSSAYVPAAI